MITFGAECTVVDFFTANCSLHTGGRASRVPVRAPRRAARVYGAFPEFREAGENGPCIKRAGVQASSASVG